MKLILVKTLWGVDGGDNSHNYNNLFQKFKNQGYNALEVIRLTYGSPNLDYEKFWIAAKKFDLQVITQLHVCGGYFDDKAYVYMSSNKVDDHLESLKVLALEAKELGAIFCNVHSGHDSWSIKDSCKYFNGAIDIEKEVGIKLVHETHRQRLFFSPYNFRDIMDSIDSNDIDNLRINADLSHWCCVCEKVFDSNDPRDDWWNSVLERVSKHCDYIHARVGYEEGPQINNPKAPEHSITINAHLSWWEEIIKSQITRKLEICYICPEHGPYPYLQSLPFSNEPIAILEECNQEIARLITERFDEIINKI